MKESSSKVKKFSIDGKLAKYKYNKGKDGEQVKKYYGDEPGPSAVQ